MDQREGQLLRGSVKKRCQLELSHLSTCTSLPWELLAHHFSNTCLAGCCRWKRADPMSYRTDTVGEEHDQRSRLWLHKSPAVMNTSPGMAPSSPSLFSPSLTRRPASPGRRPPSPFRSPSPSIMTSPKLWQKAAISRLAEEFFWIGGSIVASPKWRMGQIGKN